MGRCQRRLELRGQRPRLSWGLGRVRLRGSGDNVADAAGLHGTVGGHKGQRD